MTIRTITIHLLILLLLGNFSMNTHANDTIQSVILYTPYSKISIPPGESIDYTIDVINHTKEVIDAPLSVKGLARSWEYSLKSGGWSISKLSVLPDEKKNFNLKLEVPMKVNKGTYHFTVEAEGLATLPLTVVVSEQGTYQTEFTTNQPNMEGNAKANFTFTTSLRNRTAEQQLYALRANVERGWNVIFRTNHKQATSAQVEPNATENITIEVTPPANVEAGTYRIPVQAYTNNTSASLEFEVVITGSYEMSLTTPRGLLSADITAGEGKRIDLVVRNNGSAELKDIQLSGTKLKDWEISFEPAKIETLNAGETAEVSAIVKASKKALPGDYVIRVDAKTPEVNSTVDFRFTVKTPLIWGWMGILIILAVIGTIFYLFRKYGRR